MEGGGVWCNGGTVIITNNLIFDNESNEDAGGIFILSTELTIKNSTINGNVCEDNNKGSGIYKNSATGTVTILNSIISNNVGLNSYGIYCENGTINITYSNVYNNETGNYYNCSSGTGCISLNPFFVDLINNDFHLSNSSPCLSTATSTGAPSDDLDGRSRPLGSGFDIGCYEQYDDGTLPVTLSSFTVEYNNLPQLLWTTQSETENLGYNIYRSEIENGYSTGDFIQINGELINGMVTCSFCPDKKSVCIS